MLAPAPLTSLEDMKGYGSARALDFWAAYAADLPPPLCDTLRSIGSAFFTKFMRVRLDALFEISQSDAEETIAIVVDKDATGWRKAIEAQAGFVFRHGGNVPASAALVMTVAPDASPVELKLSQMEKRVAAGATTISDDMMVAGALPDNPINESCFSVFTVDPLVETVPKEELTDFIEAVLTQMLAEHLKSNVGAPLLMKMAAQAHRRIKYLPRRGLVAGKDRRFKNMFYDICNNRTYVRRTRSN